MAGEPPGYQDPWYVVRRWQAYAGEVRASFLRLLAILALYTTHLLNYYAFQPPGLTEQFHQLMTAMAGAWCVFGAAVVVTLRRQYFPEWLKYAVTAVDLAFLTALLTLAGGPESPLVVGYFLILVLATLRFSLGLISFTTLGCLLGYLVVLGEGHPAWWGANDPHQVPRHQQLVTAVALVLTGAILGQVVRRVKGMAQELVARRLTRGADA